MSSTEAYKTVTGSTEDQFGIVHVRTDGRRLLVVTRGSSPEDVEAYAYTVDASHAVKQVSVTSA